MQNFIQRVREAKKRLDDLIVPTSLAYAPKLSQIAQASIYLKKENLQLTGAFKIRGAFNKIASLPQSVRQKGVIAASAGNHAQGVAYSSRHFGIPSVIVMPEATPLLKVGATKELGAEVVLAGDNYDEAYQRALQIAQERDLVFIHPFADEEVIAGQGTIALEMIEQMDNIDTVVVPVGGGGLIGGIAGAYKALKPSVRIIGVVAKGADAMKRSFEQGHIQKVDSVRTIADGIAVRDVNALNFELIQKYVDAIVSVDDEEIASAILFLIEKQKLVVEGAGATCVASVLRHKFEIDPKENVALVLSGGNIDVSMLGLIIEKGLLKTHRKMKFEVCLVDKPGSLQNLTDILTKAGANIVQIDYDRTSATLEYGDALVTMALETKGKEHKELVFEQLRKNGYHFKEIN